MQHNSVFKVLFLTCIANFMMHIHSNNSMSDYLVDDTGKAQPALLELLQELGVPHDGTLATIVPITQQLWLRKIGTERWHIQEQYANKRDRLLELCNRLGCLQEIKPVSNNYSYAVMLGATMHSMRDRLAYIIQCWNNGVRFNELVFLVSERPLDKQQETMLDPSNHPTLPYKTNWQEVTRDWPATEHDAMRLIYNQTALPEKLAAIPATFINTPMQRTADGKLRRANTGDTLYAWLATNTKPGACLFVSDQPYVGYQDAVVRTCMPREFPVDTVGAAENNPPHIPVFLDTLARWLYQEQQRRLKTSKTA